MSILSARTVGCMFGVPTTTSVPFTVCSLSSGDITVSVPGSTPATITPASIGGGQGYVGNGTISGLSPLTRYQATVTQNVNTETQYFWTAPESGDDFCFIFASCDRNFNAGNGDDGHSWAFFRSRIDSNGLINGIPCIGVFFVDDHGYVDSMNIEGVAAAQTESGFARGWLSNFGLYDGTDFGAKWAREENRAWCYANLNRYPMWGDHEFVDDIAWDNGQDKVTMVNAWTHGKTVWNAFMAPLQGTRGTLDSTATHWYADLGDVRLMTLDGITNSDAAVTNYTDGAETQITTLYGNNQIDDVLTWAGSSHAFKLLGLGHSVKYVATAGGERGRGAQHPIKDHCPTEYKRLFTRTDYAGDPASLMAQSTTNGASGSLVCLMGDYHNVHSYKHAAAAYTNNAAEWFYEVGVGTVNGSTNAVSTNAPTGTVYEGSTVEYMLPDAGPSTFHWGGLLITCTGSAVYKELNLELSMENEVVWNKRLVHRLYRNDMIDASVDIPKVSSMAPE